jgi:hypothetical protein
MPSPDLDFPAGHVTKPDVGTPQAENLVWPSYHSECRSDIVSAGRAKSAVNREQVPGARTGSEALLEEWSRGCRRAYVSFWFWQWSRLSPLAPKRLSRPRTRSPLTRSTPASTSNLPERARQLRRDRPAPNFGRLRDSAVGWPCSPENSAVSLLPIWAAGLLSPIGSAGCHDRSMDQC